MAVSALRITFLNPTGQIGGAERCLLDLLQGLKELHPQWRLSVLTSTSGPLIEELSLRGVSTSVCDFPESVARLADGAPSDVRHFRALRHLMFASRPLLGYVRVIRNVLRQQGSDIVHTNGLKMHGIGAFAAPRSAKLLWHMHDYLSSRPLMKPLLQVAAGRCSLAVGNSESVSNDLRFVFGSRLRVRTIHNGTDLQRFNPVGPKLDLDTLSKLSPAASGTVRVGLVATMAPWKGHEVFLMAIAKLPTSLKVRAYVIGGAIYETAGFQRATSHLQTLARTLGIDAHVGFTSHLSDVPAAMRALDIVVHASTAPEPFGMVIIEAMACGRPLVISNAGGAAEIAGDGTFALLHSPGDVEQLAGAIKSLVENPGMRESFGIRARQRAEQQFGRLRFAENFAEAYSDMVTRAHR